jgi:hypothetical protein
MLSTALAFAALPACSVSASLDGVTDSGVFRPFDGGGADVVQRPDAANDAAARDALAKDAARHEASSGDAANDDAPSLEGGADAGPPVPVGTTLAAGSGVLIQGVTDDGYVIYVTPTSVSCIPVAGGTPSILVAAPGGTSPSGVLIDFAFVVHDVVFLWSNVESNAGTLSVWTSWLGAPVTITSNGSVDLLPAVSADSSTIAYATDADGTLSLFGASIAALASPVKLASGMDSGTGGCFPSAAFTGQAAPFHLVASYCVVGSSETDGPNQAYSYPTSTWAPTELATNVTAFVLDAIGTRVAVGTSGGQLETIPVAGGAALPIDAAGTLGSYPSLYLSQSDGFVLYINSAEEALMRSPVTTSAPESLTACYTSNCVEGLVGRYDLLLPAVSPDENWVFAYPAVISLGTDFAFPSGIILASTSTATDSWVLTGSSANPSSAQGDPFTVDSDFGVFMQWITVDGGGRVTGELDAVSTAAPSTVTMLTATAFSSIYAGTPSDLALTGSEISYVDNFSYDDEAVDLHVIDLASATTSTTLMRRINPNYVVSSDKTTIIYSVNLGGATDGLYAVMP